MALPITGLTLNGACEAHRLFAFCIPVLSFHRLQEGVVPLNLRFVRRGHGLTALCKVRATPPDIHLYLVNGINHQASVYCGLSKMTRGGFLFWILWARR